MSDVRIRLLGDLDVSVDGRTVDAFESQSARALLARLAVDPGRALPRTMLAELLWPDRPEGAASGNLRHCLAALRRSIGDDDSEHPVLVATRSTIGLADDVSVDLTEFVRLSSVAATASGAVAAWEAAVALRRGPFLAGFDLPSSETWDTWLATMRATVDRATATALHHLADLRERTGERSRAAGHVRDWIDLDPWDEHAHRSLIRLLALDGTPGTALAHADEFAATIEAELGIGPSPQTCDLVDDIRTGAFPVRVASAPDLPPRPATASVSEPCVGRTDELAWLHDHLIETQTGSGRTVFVIGQPGSGKSILLQAFERDSIDRIPNLVVLRGACHSHRGAGQPFLPLRQIVGQLLGDIELDWMRGTLAPHEATQLWLGMPDAVEAVLDLGPYLLGTVVDAEALSVRFERAFPGHDLVDRLQRAVVAAQQRKGDPTRRRQPLVEQLVRVLARIAASRPLLVTIDDVQWADSGTLDVLLSLGPRSERVPMLVVAALRPGELDTGPDPVRVAMDEIVSRSHAPCRLDLVGSRTFVDAWLDSEPNTYDDDFRDRLYRATGGNALFTVEVVGAMQEAGRLRLDGRGRWFVAHRDDLDLPARVQATIATRLSALPDELHRDLEVAALVGSRFPAEVVAHVRGVPSHDVVLRLSGLCVTPSSLLRSAGSEPLAGSRLNHFRFRHVLFQQHLLDHLPPAVRRQTQESIGRALEEIFAADPEPVAADLGAHFDEAGLIEPAVEYLGLAGHVAAGFSAYDEAIDRFERALELLRDTEPTDDAGLRELVLLTALGTCRQAHSGYNAPETAAVYERLREITRSVPPSYESAGAVGSLLTIDGLRGGYLDALAEAEQLLDLAAALESPPIDMVARMQLGWMLLMVGRLVEADEQLTIAIERHDPAWDEWLTPLVGAHVHSTALAWQAVTAWHLGRFEQARQSADESIEAARAADFPFGLAFALAIGGCIMGELFDEPQRVATAAEEVALIAHEEDFAFYRAAARIHGGTARLLAGDAATAAVEIRCGLKSWVELGTGAFVAWSRTWLVEALVRNGDLDGAHVELAEIDRMLADGEERLTELRRAYVGGLLHRAEGDTRSAAGEFRNVVRLAQTARARGPELQARAALDALPD